MGFNSGFKGLILNPSVGYPSGLLPDVSPPEFYKHSTDVF